jgi:hypothetical protein
MPDTSTTHISNVLPDFDAASIFLAEPNLLQQSRPIPSVLHDFGGKDLVRPLLLVRHIPFDLMCAGAPLATERPMESQNPKTNTQPREDFFAEAG